MSSYLLKLTLLIACLGVAINGVSSLDPPHTCTTSTTVCEPEVAPRRSLPMSGSNQNMSSQGKPGKRGPSGEKGEKGDKGNPCQCDVADEETIAELRRRMEEIEEENARLRDKQSGYGNLGSPSKPGRSCFHLLQEGQHVSAIYSIQVDENSTVIQVYCDMDTAKGGWTLVASVHENNIDGKCTAGDLWSSEQGDVDDTGTKNWENFNVFGSADVATSADYKSQAFYSLKGSDVMIWHVPNDVPIDRASDEAFLKYYTNTSFLDNYHGNLRSLFGEYFPMEKSKIEFKPKAIDRMISDLRTQSAAMRGQVPSFHLYNYDGTTNNFISDGGNDMYDSGNWVYFRAGGNNEIQIIYNEQYRNESLGFEVISSSSQHPFHTLMWLGNEDRAIESYAIRVQGDAGADDSGSYATRTGSLSHQEFALYYNAYSIYSATDPSICKVFYYIKSQLWGSVVSSVSRSPWTSGTNTLVHGVIFRNFPRSFLVGYTLLSRTAGSEVVDSQIREVLDIILKRMPTFTDKTLCNSEEDVLTQPIIYVKGNDGQLSDGIPPTVKPYTSPGFIQFRAFNKDGYPNALCPGVKTSSCRPESVCVGGINTISTDKRACGDFAGWQGDSGNAPSKTSPSGAAKSLNDVNSSILIFTRP